MMNFLLGVLLLGLGVSIFVKEFFDVEIPVVRFFVAAALIYLGATMVFGRTPVWFCQRQVIVTGSSL